MCYCVKCVFIYIRDCLCQNLKMNLYLYIITIIVFITSGVFFSSPEFLCLYGLYGFSSTQSLAICRGYFSSHFCRSDFTTLPHIFLFHMPFLLGLSDHSLHSYDHSYTLQICTCAVFSFAHTYITYPVQLISLQPSHIFSVHFPCIATIQYHTL